MCYTLLVTRKFVFNWVQIRSMHIFYFIIIYSIYNFIDCLLFWFYLPNYLYTGGRSIPFKFNVFYQHTEMHPFSLSNEWITILYSRDSLDESIDVDNKDVLTVTKKHRQVSRQESKCASVYPSNAGTYSINNQIILFCFSCNAFSLIFRL